MWYFVNSVGVDITETKLTQEDKIMNVLSFKKGNKKTPRITMQPDGESCLINWSIEGERKMVSVDWTEQLAIL